MSTSTLSIEDNETVLVLKTVNKDMTSKYVTGIERPTTIHSAYFIYPTSGVVEDINWEPSKEFGNCLDGFLWGEGDGSLISWRDDAKWMVIKVLNKDIIKYSGSVSYAKGEVIHVGDRKSATDLICSHPKSLDKKVIGCYRTVGDNGIAVGGTGCVLTGGEKSKLTGGNGSILNGGHSSILTAGNNSTLVSHHFATLTSGNNSNLKASDRTILTAGYHSILNAGESSSLTAGDDSTLIAGGNSSLTAGFNSTLIAGYWSILSAGVNSILTWKIWDIDRYRHHTVYVGENGIKPNTKYTFKEGKVVEVT